MSPILQCVPNLSEGRNLAALDQLWSQLQQIDALQCLQRSADADHHRSVLTLAGPPESMRQAVHLLFAWAAEQIDLRQHQGVHPRLGAVDVVPFVPLSGITPAEAVSFSQQMAAEVAARWHLPVYLYEQSAQQDFRRALPEIRRGGLEQLAQKMQTDPAWLPDQGPAAPHPSLGVTVLGVRKLLIAWNVFLNSSDLSLAQAIARSIRAKNGGFPALRALGLYLPQRQQVQVSMNLLDFEQTSLWTIWRRIRDLAAAAGVQVDQTEFIGLPPRRALMMCGLEALQAGPGLGLEQILEERLLGGGSGDSV